MCLSVGAACAWSLHHLEEMMPEGHHGGPQADLAMRIRPLAMKLKRGQDMLVPDRVRSHWQAGSI
ncbi:hypothetical protein SAMN05446635_6792 [Burkholderia sp. OK233]|nr:hypothetical protein SAMN05446635_6792 [Burkholderia sp. OK233]